jgi:hypothetical protein
MKRSQTKRSARKRSGTKKSRAKRSRNIKRSARKRSRAKHSVRKRSGTTRSRAKQSRQSILKNVLDYKKLLRNTPKSIRDKLPVTLKKHRLAGTGLFATKNIRKGQVISYYRMKVHTDSNKKRYRSPTKCMYCFTIYTKNGNASNNLLGDIDIESAPLPKKLIPFWAYFSNEPSGKQVENAEIDMNLDENYKKRSKVRDGDYMIYKLIATKPIKAGQEVVWCYGGAYDRNYKTSCDCENC